MDTHTTAQQDVDERADAGALALFVNTGARQGNDLFERARAALERGGARLLCAEALDDADALTRLARAAVEGGARRVVVGGGDGTLGSVAAVLAGTDAALGVLPLGTGNDFARSLHIPIELEAACQVALTGAVREVDVGVAGDRLFLNAAGVGISAEITRRLSPGLKRKLGRGAFAVAAAGGALNHPPFRATLAVDGEVHTFDAQQVVVGNGRYHGGGRLVAPEASLDDRRLHAYVIRAAEAPKTRLQNLWTLVRVGALLRKGRHLDHPAVEHFSGLRIDVAAEPEEEVNVDGELVGTTPVSFRIRPRALKVVVPRAR